MLFCLCCGGRVYDLLAGQDPRRSLYAMVRGASPVTAGLASRFARLFPSKTSIHELDRRWTFGLVLRTPFERQSPEGKGRPAETAAGAGLLWLSCLCKKKLVLQMDFLVH